MVQIKISNDSDKVVNFIDTGFELEINHQNNIVRSLDGAKVLTRLSRENQKPLNGVNAIKMMSKFQHGDMLLQ
jgi:hypothetical protein